MNTTLGDTVRKKREALYRNDKSFSLRQVAARIGVQPSYLSRIERGEQLSLSEDKAIDLAKELSIDQNVMLAMMGKVSKKLQAIIRRHPDAFAKLIKSLEKKKEHEVLEIVRVVRDGKW